MSIIETDTLNENQKLQLSGLWNSVYPENVAYHSLSAFEEYLAGLEALRHLLLVDPDLKIHGWAFSFNRKGERWFAILLDASIQGKGMGRLLMDKLKVNEQHLYGWVVEHDDYKKLDGSPYRSPLSFYLNNGFKICDDARFDSDKLSTIKIQWHH